MYSTYMCSLLNFSWDRKLVGHTVFITGASRGIGKAIALKLAKDGANVVIAAKTTEPHPNCQEPFTQQLKKAYYQNIYICLELLNS